jgi:hypothetical protein
MFILNLAIIAFCFIETLNIVILYFKPDLKKGNGVALFESWFDAKEDKNLDLFVHYMAYWVAGTKLIFIMLLLVILFIGSEMLKFWTCVIMAISIASYFWKLHPIICELDNNGKLSPAGYSKTLPKMINGIIIVFLLGITSYLIIYT